MVRVRVGSGWPAQNTGWVTSQPVFILSKKKKKSGLDWVFSNQVELDQKILTLFAMFT